MPFRPSTAMKNCMSAWSFFDSLVEMAGRFLVMTSGLMIMLPGL
jgi:hypothetical protein